MAVSFVHRGLMSLAVPLRLRLMRECAAQTSWTFEQIRAYQDRKVRELVSYCWQSVPFYRKHWSSAIRSPEEIRSVTDLQHLPVVTKDLWRENLASLMTRDPSVRSSPARTGGSTGRPTEFRMTKFDEELCWGQMYLGWHWAGFNPGDPFLVVGGESIGVGLGDKRTWRDWIMHRWITSGSNLSAARARELAAAPHFRAIRFVYGYPNAIRELGELLVEIGALPPRVRGIVCTAEVMRPEVREDIARAFGGVPVHDQWGMNDGGLFAAEGPDRDGLHVFFRRGLLEILDADNKPITELNRPGRAVATCLTNLATPFVRYETGDEVHWRSMEPAPSGITWPRIGPVDGRTGDVIYLPSGRRIAMPGLTLVMRWLDGLRQYQFIQTGPDEVTVRLDTDSTFGLTEADVIGYLQQKIAAEVRWRVTWGKPELTQNGKLLLIRNDWARARGLSRPRTSSAVH